MPTREEISMRCFVMTLFAACAALFGGRADAGASAHTWGAHRCACSAGGGPRSDAVRHSVRAGDHRRSCRESRRRRGGGGKEVATQLETRDRGRRSQWRSRLFLQDGPDAGGIRRHRPRQGPHRGTCGRPAPSSPSCRTRPAPIYPLSIRRLSPPTAGSRSSRAANSSAQSVAAAPPATKTGLQGWCRYGEIIAVGNTNGDRGVNAAVPCH